MSEVDDILKTIPIGDIAKQLGISDDAARSAVEQAVPTILGGMHANAESGGGGSLERALAQHAGKADGPVSLDTVDAADGDRIVQHVLGANTDQVATKLADSNRAGEVTKDVISKVLPLVAPIVMAWLANKFLGGDKSKSASAGSGNVLGDVVGSVLGGGSSSSGGGIGSILGGLLGGGSGSSSSGGGLLGGILGGLLGGGTK